MLAVLCSLGLVACGVGPDEAEPSPSHLARDTSALGTVGEGFAYIDPNLPDVNPNYLYNSTGGAVTYETLAGFTGRYKVRFVGLGRAEGDVQVVAYGSTPERCRVDNWTPEGTTLAIYIRCHAPNGDPAASAFVVSYLDMTGMVQTYPLGAYLWTGAATATTVPGAISVPTNYQWNSTGGANSVTQTATGRYTVTLVGMNFSNASVHVTAYGGTNAQHCKVLSWGAGAVATVYVGCYDTTGNPVDSMFTFSFERETLIPNHVGGHAWINGPTSAPAAYQKLANEVICIAPGTASVTHPEDNYVVSFSKSGAFNHSMSMVTGYGANSNYCKVVRWIAGPGPTETWVEVRCFDKDGVMSPSSFTVTYTSAYVVGPC
ncbi:hypothetical protein JGU66_35820 [Myxococcaceae bacterium JPH2]|nr:hypothetical protein [Myxococcaceae bacterium JPH2]